MLHSSSVAVTGDIAVPEERFNRIETKLDAVVADVADLKIGQTAMEERLTSKMLTLHEDTIARLRTISEAQGGVPEEMRARDAGLTADMTLLFDADRHYRLDGVCLAPQPGDPASRRVSWARSSPALPASSA
jgi:hypothetical protein